MGSPHMGKMGLLGILTFFWITFDRMESNLIVATRSPTQIEFISSAGCAHTFALYGFMKDSVSACKRRMPVVQDGQNGA